MTKRLRRQCFVNFMRTSQNKAVRYIFVSESSRTKCVLFSQHCDASSLTIRSTVALSIPDLAVIALRLARPTLPHLCCCCCHRCAVSRPTSLTRLQFALSTRPRSSCNPKGRSASMLILPRKTSLYTPRKREKECDYPGWAHDVHSSQSTLCTKQCPDFVANR